MVTDRPLGLCDWGFSSSFFWFAAPPKNNSRAIMSKKSLVKYRSTGSPRFWLVEMSYTQWCYYLKMFKTSIHVTDKSSHDLKIFSISCEHIVNECKSTLKFSQWAGCIFCFALLSCVTFSAFHFCCSLVTVLFCCVLLNTPSIEQKKETELSVFHFTTLYI